MKSFTILALLVFIQIWSSHQSPSIQGNELPETYVSDADIQRISEEMWVMDDNRMKEGDFKVNPDGHRFITDVDDSKLQRSTYALMVPLFDNFNPVIGEDDKDCSSCRIQEREFLTAVLKTRLMQRLWKFLAAQGLASASEQGFRDQLCNYWFTRYSRSQGKAMDSSGFEHVFAGELKSTTASGFHNWVQFYRQEEKGNLKYSNYLQGCDPQLHVTSFYWHGKYKRIGSLFVGTSPEYELAIYTLCFLTRSNGKCPISANGSDRFVTTYSMNNVKPRTVGTAYPDC